MPSYITDGTDLYEVVGETIDENFGLARGQIRRTYVRTCRAPYRVRVLDDFALSFFRFVWP